MPVVKSKVGNPERASQFKQPSRKGKKAWRKNVDVTEVEQGLEEVNEKIIKGEVFAAEKTSDQLFTLDTTRDASVSARLPKPPKALKADEIIAARSAVPAVSLRKRSGDDKTTDGVLPIKRQRTNYVTQKELIRIKKVADGHHESAIEIMEADHDVWVDPKEEEKGDEVFEFLPKQQKKKAPKTLREQPISLAANGKQIPAVPMPSGGYSYRPVWDDYEKRWIEESDKIVAAEQKRLAELEAERLKLEAAARSAAEAEAAEARADLSEWEEDSAWEGLKSGGEEEPVAVKKSKRKTPAQRNRIKRRKEEEGKVKHEARMKEKLKQAQRIKEIALEVAERERNLELAKMEMGDGAEEGNDDVLRRRPLGNGKLPEKDLEFMLPEEVAEQDSLRKLKPEGNLLKDRYRNMLVRGKMEARKKIPYRKQAKTKMVEKWTFKDFTF